MTHRAKIVIAAMVLPMGLAWLAAPSAVVASEKIAEVEGMVCTACHDKPGSKLLTDQGKYFELMGSADGFVEVEAAFESCTTCHVRKPGSKKLTKTGRQFSFFVGDMKGLRAWVKDLHPGWPVENEADTAMGETPADEPEGDNP